MRTAHPTAAGLAGLEDGARREVTMINLDSGKQLFSELIRDWDQHLAHRTVAELTQ